MYIKNENPQEPTSSGPQKINQLNYIEEKEKRQMAKYHVNPLAVEDVDCSVLIEAVARYLTVVDRPSIEITAAILGIEKISETEEEEKE